MMRPIRSFIALMAALIALSAGASCVAAQPSGQMRREFEGVGIEEELGATIPLDLTFQNAAGDTVTLGQYFDGERPVMLTLNYYDCPMLCPLMLDQYTRTLKAIDWVPGNQFEAVTVSFDPDETPKMARAQQKTYLDMLGKPEARDGWHFLTGDPSAIQALTQAVGFNYRKVEGKDEYAHPTAVIFLSGTGTVTRYIYGMEIPASDTRQALVEASQGKVGTVMDKVRLYCFQFDPEANTYTADAFALMRIAGVLAMFILGGTLVFFWRRERDGLRPEAFDRRMEEGLDEHAAA